jgi:YfiH family protein
MTLDVITSDALSPKHGYFCRAGGISTGIYKGLNTGLGSNDDPKNVLHNRGLVAEYLGVPLENLGGVHQIHSATVHIATPETIAERPQADALVTNHTGLAFGVLAADCAPILFADATAGVIGAAHSGWKGAIGGVAASTIAEMIKLGATREHITAVVGPCISQANYEVGPEFLDEFTATDMDFTRFFTNGTGDRYLFDLPSFCLHQLRSEGIAHAEWVGHCTYADETRFYSYRRTTHRKESDYGRMISAIVL